MTLERQIIELEATAQLMLDVCRKTREMMKVTTSVKKCKRKVDFDTHVSALAAKEIARIKAKKLKQAI
jgi:hypothetical protein